jgi:hypothetical protein
MLRHQLVTAAALPAADAPLQAAAARQFEAVIDEIAERLAGRDPSPVADQGMAKVRRLT